MQELANVLGRERVQLEFLLFKTVELRQLMGAGEDRFLRWAAEEMLRAGQQLRITGLARSRQLQKLACALVAESADLTLTVMAQRTPEPWRTIFADHDANFRRLVAEIEAAINVAYAVADASGHSVVDVFDEVYRPTWAEAAEPVDGSTSMVLP